MARNSIWIFVLIIGTAVTLTRLDPLIQTTADQMQQEPDPFEQLMEMRQERSGIGDGWLVALPLGVIVLSAGSILFMDRVTKLTREMRLGKRKKSRKKLQRPSPAPLPSRPIAEVRPWPGE